MAGRTEGGDDVGPPAPEGRGWIHPSELPGSGRRSRRRRHRFAVPVTAGLAGALAAFGVTTLALSSTPSTSAVSSTTSPAERQAAALAGQLREARGVTDAAERVAAGIVRVTGWNGGQAAYGSGIVYRDDGFVVASARFVEDAAAVEVTTAGGETLDTELVGVDPDYDLALLRADLSELDDGDSLTPLSFPDADAATGPDGEGEDRGASAHRDDLHVGDACVVVGAGQGMREGLLATRAVVAGLGRVAPVGERWMVDVIEIDTATDPAMTGGPLLDPSGDLLGVVVGDAGEVTLGSLVVPAARARRSVEALLEHGHVAHPWLGVAATDAPDPRGAAIVEVVEGAPADESGLLPGDVVVRLGDLRIDGMAELMRAVRHHEVGDEVPIVVDREGERVEVPVTLAAHRDH